MHAPENKPVGISQEKNEVDKIVSNCEVLFSSFVVAFLRSYAASGVQFVNDQ
jgi:hypothetical protein